MTKSDPTDMRKEIAKWNLKAEKQEEKEEMEFDWTADSGLAYKQWNSATSNKFRLLLPIMGFSGGRPMGLTGERPMGKGRQGLAICVYVGSDEKMWSTVEVFLDGIWKLKIAPITGERSIEHIKNPMWKFLTA